MKKNASGKPYLIGDQDVRNLIGKFVTRSENVYFVKNYCNLLCDYIIKTELVAGMSDAIHARQLHNWLVRNCAYTTKGTRYGEEKDLHAPEFSSQSAMFLNYGLYGVGEGVCAAYAYAYEKLLHTAHIDSYVLSNADEKIESDDHAWTLAKLDGKWYQIDVTTDDVQSCYKYFMKTNSQMEKLNKAFTFKDVGVHPSIYQTTNGDLDAGVSALKQAIYSYQDANGDGILDGDWNLDGVKNSADTAFKKRLIQAQGSASAVQDSKMNQYVAMLHRIRMSPEKYLQSEGY